MDIPTNGNDSSRAILERKTDVEVNSGIE